MQTANPHTIRKRLWQAALLMASVVIAVIGSNIRHQIVEQSQRLSLGHDLLPSYAAGRLVRDGRAREMYDHEAIAGLERKIIIEATLDMDASGGRYGPWLNPPFYAWVFVPLAALPYRDAATVFLGVNLILVALSLVLLTNMMARPEDPSDGELPWKTVALAPLLIVLPLPFWQVMGHQQNTFVSLIIMVLAIGCWRNGRPVLAGLVAGLLFFKPQLAALLALAMVATMGRRAMLGLAVMGVTLLAINILTLPGTLGDFFTKLPPILHVLQKESAYNWGRQVTFQSFWRLLLQGQVRGETSLLATMMWFGCSGAILAGLAWALYSFRKSKRDAISRDRLIAAVVVSMPMLMPYYMDYDLLLLAIPAILLAREWNHHPHLITRADYVLLWTWVLFAFESHFNPGVAGGSRFNPAVPLLAALSALHIWRCIRPVLDTSASSSTHRKPAPMAAIA